MSKLTNIQIKEIVNVVIEDFGPSLDKDQLTDSVLLILEDVSGFETPTSKEVDDVIKQVWRIYNEHHHNP